MRVTMLETGVSVLSKPDGASLLLTRLSMDDEVELGKAVKEKGVSWVEVALPDGRRGYIAGETKIYKITSASINQDEVDLFEQPAFRGARKARLVKGHKILLLKVVPGENGDWVRVRDLKGVEGYIHGETRILKEGSKEGADKTPPVDAGRPVQAPSRKPRTAGTTDIRNGIVAIIFGLIVTGGSYLLAPQLGGKYYITWGLVVLGVLWLLRGVFRVARGK